MPAARSEGERNRAPIFFFNNPPQGYAHASLSLARSLPNSRNPLWFPYGFPIQPQSKPYKVTMVVTTVEQEGNPA